MSRNPFVLTAAHFGPMIANRLDYYKAPDGSGFCGVGCDLMEWAEYRRKEVDAAIDYMLGRKGRFGPGIVVLDVGANIGTHTVPWARRMTGWGEVIAIEPQERVFYALAGNIALNNCFNARALWAAAAAKSGSMIVPVLDYQQPANFGGLSLNGVPKKDSPSVIGETTVAAIAIDDLELPRLDFLKIDVEGMELDVIEGAGKTIARCRPVIMAEANFSAAEFTRLLPRYECRRCDDLNFILEPLAMEQAA